MLLSLRIASLTSAAAFHFPSPTAFPSKTTLSV
jgi:hypothetical protein